MQDTYVKKARGQECLVYKLLQPLARKYNSRFKTLKLPEYLKIDEGRGKITLPYYKGRTYNQIWGESCGGSLMGLELSKETAKILYDFSKIRIGEIMSHNGITRINRYKFEFDKWFQIFNQEKEKFVNSSQISREEADRATNILKSDFSDPRFIFSNGDFYPRNFINIGTKIVVVDWQTWNENYRVNLIDYLENVAAFAFIHMWDNFEWQLAYLKELQKHLDLNAGDFQKSLLIKSFDQANFWFNNNDLCKKQLFIFKNALDKTYVQYLLGYTRPNVFYRALRPAMNFFR